MKIEDGSWVWSHSQRQRAKVIEVIELWGQFRYRLWFPHNDQVLVHTAEDLRSLDESENAKTLLKAHDVRFAATLGKVAGLVNEDKLLSPLASSVIPLPHQVSVLQKVISRPQVRYLLADEVGLGKTIEAGLAIKELKMRGRIQRTLVVAPKGLVPQWIVEMQDRFGEEFRYFAPSDFSGYRKISGEENVWKSFDQVICSMDAVKPLETRRGWTREQIADYNQDRIIGLSSAGWDLVIIDEAHRVAGSGDTVARHAMARHLADAAPHILLLSATPHQGKSDAFHRLMTLLDADAFPDESTVNRDSVQDYVARTEKRNAIDNRGNPLFTPRLTKLVPIPWGDHSDQKELYEAVTSYVREGYNQAVKEKNTPLGFLMILMQRLIASSTAAIATTLERRIEVLKRPGDQLELFSSADFADLQEMDGQSQVDSLLGKQLKALKNERKEVEALYDAAQRVMAKGPDAKAEALLSWISKLQQDEGDPELKVLVFTEFVSTQSMLAEFLEQSGISVVTLNGSLSMEERKRVQKAFSEETRVLISTDAGGEGLNLQFCHIIINFDLGWRPMAIEQRIGRVDRIGQKHVVKALNFALEDSVELRICEVLETKLAVILEEFGIDKTSDVLDSEAGAHMFDKLFIQALLSPDSVDSEAASLALNLSEQAKWNRKELDILKPKDASPVDVQQYISSQPIADYLESMTLSYLEGHSGSYQMNGDTHKIKWSEVDPEKAYRFSNNTNELNGELLTLDHPKIRGILADVPKHQNTAPIARFGMAGIPGGKVGGTWSLWQLRFPSIGFSSQEFFPIFLSDGGKRFDRTARSIWDQLPNAQLTEQPSMEIDQDKIYAQHDELAREIGRPIYETLKRKHESFIDERIRNAQQKFQSRREQLKEIGLPEVRNFRLRQLELEEATSLKELNRQKRVLPELNPVVLIRLEPS